MKEETMSAKLFGVLVVVVAVCVLIPAGSVSAERHTEEAGAKAAAPSYACNDMSDTWISGKGLRRGMTHSEVLWLRSFIAGGGQAVGMNQDYVAQMLSIPVWQVQYFMGVFRLTSHLLLSADRNDCGIYMYITPFGIWTEPQMP
jgi:hypothetical protein